MEAAEQELRATLLTLVGDVASSYVEARGLQARIAYARQTAASQRETEALTRVRFEAGAAAEADVANATGQRSEEHTSELQSLMRISYAVFCLKKKKMKNTQYITQQ